MLVADLNHFQDLPDEVPGPARRLAAHLGGIVRAATAGQVGTAWVSALPCGRRPGHLPCPGRMILRRPEPPSPIHWACSNCADEGVISCWENSPYDLRRPTPTVTGRVREITVTEQVAAALRELRLLDTDRARVVFGIRVDGPRLVLTATDDDLDRLIGQLATEADHEPNRRRRQRLHIAHDALQYAQPAG